MQSPKTLAWFMQLEECQGTEIRAAKSCNLSLNVVALQDAERMLFVLLPPVQQILLMLQKVERVSTSTTKSRLLHGIVMRGTFTLQPPKQTRSHISLFPDSLLFSRRLS